MAQTQEPPCSVPSVTSVVASPATNRTGREIGRRSDLSRSPPKKRCRYSVPFAASQERFEAPGLLPRATGLDLSYWEP